MIVLGIESSCDETAAAVVEDGTRVLSSQVSSQVHIHHRFGGVVPELASRMHMEAIVPVVDQALVRAGVGRDRVEAVAVTRGPGLVGALLVGFSFAKAFAFARAIPWVGVDHLEGHIYSLFLGENPPPFPFTVLLASGGHTNLYHITGHDGFRLLGRTRDDAAGEAFDKVAKMLGLGYPGGALIETLGEGGDPAAIAFPRTFLDPEGFDFSFSGLKSAVARYIHDNRDRVRERMPDIAAGFQAAVVDVLCGKLLNAARATGVKHIAVAGGVAANQTLTSRLAAGASAAGLTLHLPPRRFCGDNAAMIAARGHRLLLEGHRSSLADDVFSRSRA
jgi:N6-L-threonylcarbamoyladenine synthase